MSGGVLNAASGNSSGGGRDGDSAPHPPHSSQAPSSCGVRNAYVPSFMPPGSSAVRPTPPFPSQGGAVDAGADDTMKRKKKTKEIDVMLEEMKRAHEAGGGRPTFTPSGSSRLSIEQVQEYRRLGMAMGSLHGGDPDTTNLHVGNIAPTVDEQVLMNEFVRFGPIASVKIMWPRTDEQFSKGRNTGFVAFMTRESAALALEHMDGVSIHTHAIKLGWSKAVSVMPKEPIWPPKGVTVQYVDAEALRNATKAKRQFGGVENAHGKQGETADDNDNNDKDGDGDDNDDTAAGAAAAAAALVMDFRKAKKTQVPAQPRKIVTIDAETRGQDGNAVENTTTDAAAPTERFAEDIRVIIPPSSSTRFVIDTVASYVAQDGHMIEKHIIARECGPSSDEATTTNGIEGKPAFRFLMEPTSAEGVYYTWRVFSLTNGDNFLRWRQQPFFMVEGGPRWIPPACPDIKRKDETTMDALTARYMRQLQSSGGRLMLKTQEEKEKERDPTAAQRLSIDGKGESAATAGVVHSNNAGRRLEEREVAELRNIVDRMSPERESIVPGMLFALDHAECALHVTELIVDRILCTGGGGGGGDSRDGPATPLPTRLALLFLLNDILYNTNTSVRNASRYRSAVMPHLASVMHSMSETVDDILQKKSRMTATTLRSKVHAVLRAWRSWLLFTEDFVYGLTMTFEGGERSPAAVSALAKLRGAAENDQGALDLTTYEEELAAMSMDALARLCKLGGLVGGNGEADRRDMVLRLTAAKAERIVATGSRSSLPLSGQPHDRRL